MACLNFAGTWSHILLLPVSSGRRVIPSRKIALNLKREINYLELARRPWVEDTPPDSWHPQSDVYCLFQGGGGNKRVPTCCYVVGNCQTIISSGLYIISVNLGWGSGFNGKGGLTMRSQTCPSPSYRYTLHVCRWGFVIQNQPARIAIVTSRVGNSELYFVSKIINRHNFRIDHAPYQP